MLRKLRVYCQYPDLSYNMPMITAETKILVITYQEHFIAQIQDVLRELGYINLTFVSSSLQVYQLVREILPDLVFLDTTHKKTAEWLKIAQQIQITCAAPLILLRDCDPEDESLKQVELVQPFDYLLKPLDPKTTALTIELLLTKKKLQVTEQKFTTFLAQNQELEVTNSKYSLTSDNYKTTLIPNDGLLEVEREQRELAEALREVGAVLNGTLDFNTVLDRLLDQVGRVAPYDTGNVFLIDQGFARVVRTRGHERFGPDVARIAATLSFNLATTPNLRQLAENKEPLLISDTSTDPHWLKGEAWGHVRSWIGAPIVAQGQAIAFFSLDKTEPGFYQTKHAEHLAVFASQAALALENARLFEAEARRRHEAETLREAAAALTSALNLERVLDNILTHLEQVIHYDSATVFLLEGSVLHAVAGKGLPFPEEVIGRDFPADVDDPFLKTLKHTQRPLYLPDIQFEPGFAHWGHTHYIRGWMAVPLVGRGRFIGYVTLDSRQVAAYGPQEAHLAQAFANHAAAAIENAQLFQAVEAARQLSDSLREIATLLAASLDPGEVMNRVLDSLAKVIAYDSASIMLKEGRAFQIKAGRGLPPNTPGLKLPFRFQDSELHGQLYEGREPIIISDIRQDPRWIKIAGDEYIRNWLAVPLLVRDKVIGALNLDKREPGFYTEEHVFIVSAFAQHAAIALDNAYLFDKTRRQAQQLAFLNNLASQMTGLADVEELCTTFVQSLYSSFGWISIAILTLDHTAKQLILQAVAGGYNHLAQPGKYLQDIGQGIIGQAVKTGQIVIVNDMPTPPEFFELEGMNINSELAFPLKIGEQVIGILSIVSEQSNYFDESDVAALATVADQLAVALEKARLFSETHQRAEQLDALRQSLQDLTVLRDLDTLLRQIVERAMQLLDAEGGNVFMYRSEREVLELVVALGQKAGPVGINLKPGEGLSGKVWNTGQPLIIKDFQQWSGKAGTWADIPQLTAVGAPIRWGNEALGVLNIYADNTKRDFTSEDASLLAQFATQAAIAIHNARLYQAERARYNEAEAMRQAALALTSTIAMDQVLERILVELQRVVPYDSASVQLVKNGYLEIIGGHGFPNLPELLGIRFPIQSSDNPNTLVMESREPKIIGDVTSMGYSGFKQDPHVATNIRAWMGVPLLIGDRIIGMLALDKRVPNFYTQMHVRTAMSYAAQAAVAIENAQLYEQAQHHATELEIRVAERTFELEVLYEFTQALGQATHLSDIIRLILLHLYRTIPHDVAASLLVTESTNILVIQSQRPLSARVEADIQEIMNAVLNQPLATALEIRRIQPKAETIIRPPLEDLASIMQVPIMIGKNPAGLLFIATEQPNQFTQEQAHLLRVVANQASESIQRLQQLLAAEYNRLESLVTHLPDGIVLLNSELRIVLANPTAQKFLNVLAPTALGDQLNYLGDQPLGIITDPNTIGLPREVESINYPRQIFEVAARPIAVGPEAGGWLLVIRNVTTERAAQERVQQQDRLAAVGQLAAGIAHDFNNILTSMIGFAELARLDPSISPPVSEDLQRIIQQGQRAAALIRQILDFSRQSITEKRTLNFAVLLKETVKLLERTIPEDIRIILEIEPKNQDAYILNGDLSQLQQVLANLAVNARDAMPVGGLISFRLARLTVNPGQNPPYPGITPGGWIVLSISDTGVGISPEALPRIFEPFFTTKEVGKGTGLGLAQAYGIITQHDGYIDVQTEFGKGTNFTIYLPTMPSLPKTIPQTAETEIIGGQGELLLLVEDDLAVLEVTRVMLENLGYRVITAPNGRHALEVYDQYHDEIALVLTDVTMPEMGGVVLAQSLQSKYPAIKVIVLTGYPLEAESKDLLDQGIVDWLQKPLNRHQLAQTIRRSLKIEPKNGIRSERR